MLLEIEYWKIIQQSDDEKYKHLFSYNYISHSYKI